MANLGRRIRKLETRFTDGTGLVPHSDEWFAFWRDKLDRLRAGEPPERIGRIPIEVVDHFVAIARNMRQQQANQREQR